MRSNQEKKLFNLQNMDEINGNNQNSDDESIIESEEQDKNEDNNYI
jgi:hypothetical protein